MTGEDACEGTADGVPGDDAVGLGAGAFDGPPAVPGDGAPVMALPPGLLDPPLSCPLIAKAPITMTTVQPAPISRVDQVAVPSVMR